MSRWLSRAREATSTGLAPAGAGRSSLRCRVVAHAFVLTLAGSLGACAAGSIVEERVVVELVQPSSEGAQIARQAGDTAQLPARYVASVTDRRHVLVLRCLDEAQCRQAIDRLRADRSSYLHVDVDERRHVHTP